MRCTSNEIVQFFIKGYYAFKNCNITELNHSCLSIREGLVIKNTAVLYRTNQATEIIIPDGVTSIGDSTFEYCSSLESVTIPDGVTSIGDGAFFDCSSLESVTIPDSVTSIGGWAFFDCSSLESVTIPDGITAIGELAFAGCSSLESVTIPDSVTSIGKWAFMDCESLKSINFKGTMKQWQNFHCIPAGLPSFTVYCSDGEIKVESDSASSAKDFDDDDFSFE